jgi:hypothetical protein
MKIPQRLLAVLLATLAGCAAPSVASAATPIAGGQFVRTAAFERNKSIRRASLFDSATVTACVTGATQADRSATFSAGMDAVPRTSTMSINFDLYEQTSPTSGYVAVNAPGFGVWQTSTRRIASFTANDNVVDLPAPAAFRALVHYRWLNRRGRVIRRDARVTSACIETSPQPDLFIVRLDHAAGSPPKTTEIYGVVVRNGGPGDAGAFEVALNVNGTQLADQQVTALAAQTATTVQFTGPRCTAGSTITAQVDPAGAITEPANTSRTMTLACPTVATGQASSTTGPSGATGS